MPARLGTRRGEAADSQQVQACEMRPPALERCAKNVESAPVYRPDIDGLRAIAVVSVALFHAGVPGFSGGYIGVDVFFVISGYLITQLLDGSRAKPLRPWLTEFYIRRARRILPALFAMTLVAAVPAIAIFLPW